MTLLQAKSCPSLADQDQDHWQQAVWGQASCGMRNRYLGSNMGADVNHQGPEVDFYGLVKASRLEQNLHFVSV